MSLATTLALQLVLTAPAHPWRTTPVIDLAPGERCTLQVTPHSSVTVPEEIKAEIVEGALVVGSPEAGTQPLRISPTTLGGADDRVFVVWTHGAPRKAQGLLQACRVRDHRDVPEVDDPFTDLEHMVEEPSRPNPTIALTQGEACLLALDSPFVRAPVSVGTADFRPASRTDRTHLKVIESRLGRYALIFWTEKSRGSYTVEVEPAPAGFKPGPLQPCRVH